MSILEGGRMYVSKKRKETIRPSPTPTTFFSLYFVSLPTSLPQTLTTVRRQPKPPMSRDVNSFGLHLLLNRCGEGISTS